MDIALAVEKILPGAEYFGSVTANTEESWDSVTWQDTRRGKPTWQELEAAAVPDIEEARAAALEKLTAKRLEEEYAGPVIEVDGKTIRFPSTIKDETRLNSLADIFAVNPKAEIPDWKVAPGVYVIMTAPLLQEVKEKGFAHIAATFSIERTKAAEIEAYESAEEIAAWLETNLTKNWPGAQS